MIVSMRFPEITVVIDYDEWIQIVEQEIVQH